LASDAGLVTGEYFLDDQTVTYQSQGQAQGIDLQYSSGQAYPHPVVQTQFTTPGGDSSSISSITAQVSLAGVVQGSACSAPRNRDRCIMKRPVSIEGRFDEATPTIHA
jgi:hypothetical protein